MNGNLSYLDSIAVLMASCIDKFESIKSLSENHSPFDNNLYWTDGQDESSALEGTSLKDFASSFISFAEIMILKVYELKVDVRKMRYTDVTDYDRVYKRASAYVSEFFGQYADTVRAGLTAFTSHSSAEAGAILQHVLSTDVVGADAFTNTGFANMRAAASLASNESATPVYELNDPNDPTSGYSATQQTDSEGDPVFYHRNTHLANMNTQELYSRSNC